jgi:acyl carrier protein
MARLTRDDATEIVRLAIADVAPDVVDELGSVDPTFDLWDVLDLDSMDHQNVMVAIFERTGVEIAERDYPSLRSLDRLADHLASVDT